MSTVPDLSVVIPAYNEQTRLEPTVRAAVDYFRSVGGPFEVIVVDDGSQDGTSALARRLSDQLPEVHLIRLAANHGKGYAVRSGVMNARGRTVLFADADGATPFAEIERLQAALEAGADVAIGSRGLDAQGVKVQAKLYRHVIGRIFHALVETLTVSDIRDTQCGFKLFRAPVAHDLFSRMRMNGFSFDVELLVMAKRRAYRVAEVPVNWTHQPGSKVRLTVDSLHMATDLVRIRMHSMRGEYDTPHVAPLEQLVGADTRLG
jgi:dolichyl-phosphate beta-glucosyltransferase